MNVFLSLVLSASQFMVCDFVPDKCESIFLLCFINAKGVYKLKLGRDNDVACEHVVICMCTKRNSCCQKLAYSDLS